MVGSSDSDSEEERRVVLSTRARALGDLREHSREVREKAREDEWHAVAGSLERLQRLADRARRAGRSPASAPPPKAYVAAVAVVEAELARAAEERPKLSPTNQKALIRLRNGFRRVADPLRAFILQYREDADSSEPASEAEAEPARGARRGGRRGGAAGSGSEAPSGSEDEETRRARTGVAPRQKDALATAEPEEVTHAAIAAKLLELSLARGKASRAEREDALELLERLSSPLYARVPAQRVQVLAALITAAFDQNVPGVAPMTPANWARCARALFDALDVLDANPNVRTSDVPLDEAALEAVAAKANARKADKDVLAVVEVGGAKAEQGAEAAAPGAAPGAAPAPGAAAPEEGGAWSVSGRQARAQAKAQARAAAQAAQAAAQAAAAAPAPSPAEPAEPAPDAPATVWCNLSGFLDRLESEWVASLRSLDPHAHEYVARLRDEPVLLALGARVAARLEAVGAPGRERAAVAVLRAHHYYAKNEAVYAALRKLTEGLVNERIKLEEEAEERKKKKKDEEAAPGGDAGAEAGAEAGANANADADADAAASPPPASFPPAYPSLYVPLPRGFALPESSSALMRSLCRTAYVFGDDPQRAAASLLEVYWLAGRGLFFEARDALLRTRVQDQAGSLDPQLGVLLNRAQAALGLAALRRGRVADAHACLAELYGSGRAKELLAQGLAAHRHGERSAEAEAAERRRQVPFHLHVNLELLEAAVLTSGALLEVPAAAAAARAPQRDARRRPASKPLRRLLETQDRQAFVGPPENARDHCAAAARALAKGDWKTAHALVASLACWSLLPEKDAVLAALETEFKVQGLRTFLITYSRLYDSISLERLAERYELPIERVHAVCSRLVADGLVAAAHDAPAACLEVRAEDPSPLLARAAAFAEKAAALVDLNERALQARTGVVSADDEDGEGAGGRGGQGGQGARRTRGHGGGLHMGGEGGGRGGRGGRQGGGNRGNRGSANGRNNDYGAEPRYSGFLFGRGRSARSQGRDDSKYMRLGRSRRD